MPSGLNYDSGFSSSSPYYSTNVASNALNNTAAQGYQNQLLQGQQIKGTSALAAQNYGYNSALQGQALSAQESMNNADIAAQEQGYQTQLQEAQIQAAAAEYPAQQQQSRFNSVFPLLSSALNSASSQVSNLSGQANTSGQPTITAAPVYTKGQIQQQVNQQQAQNDQSTATQQRQNSSTNAGRGLGANSPLSQALSMGLQNQNLATNTANAASTRLNSAQANASQLLAGQQAQETQYANRQQEAIGRSQVAQNYLSSALSSLSSTV